MILGWFVWIVWCDVVRFVGLCCDGRVVGGGGVWVVVG